MNKNTVFSYVEAQAAALQADRRFFHRHGEIAWHEVRTTLRIIARLKKLGWTVRAGKAIHGSQRLGIPSAGSLQAYRAEHREEIEALAREAAVDAPLLDEICAAHTGVVADWDSGKAGPLRAFRFDIDALPVHESDAPEHLPQQLGFRSETEGVCQACGHDGHIALGLALAAAITHFAAGLRESEGQADTGGAAAPAAVSPENNAENTLNGRFRLIFQPAEEGVEGALSMLSGGVLDGVEQFYCGHLGLGMPSGKAGLGTRGFLATEKLQIRIEGRAAHAGKNPETGRNALLAAAQLALALHSLPQYGSGMSRVNVGILRAGTAANSVPSEAFLRLETRGDKMSIVADLGQRVDAMVAGTAAAWGCTAKLARTGRAAALEERFLPAYAAFADELAAALQGVGPELVMAPDFGASEDVVGMMNAVLAQGGRAMHFLFGTNIAASHHNPRFDFQESDLLPALRLLLLAASFQSEVRTGLTPGHSSQNR